MKTLSRLFWFTLAKIIAHPSIAGWLIARSYATPYTHLDGYMNRWWVFNDYERARPSWWRNLLPSARIHHILRPDLDRNLHDHPWDARTIILKGFYVETRLHRDGEHVRHCRFPGDTATLKFGEFHKIDYTTPGGVWTLFITWKYQGTWGFLVDGKKVPHREYLAETP